MTNVDYLFDDDGLMKKATKSALLQELEKNLSEEEKQSVPSQDNNHTVLIVDVMANLRKITLKNMKTFGDMALAFITFIEKSFKYFRRIDFMFDSYLEYSKGLWTQKKTV